MSRSQLYEMTRSLIAHGKAKTMELADSVVSIPASAYTDPEQFEIEKTKIFKRMPLMLAPAPPWELLARPRTSTNTIVPSRSRMIRSISPPPRPGVR